MADLLLLLLRAQLLPPPSCSSWGCPFDSDHKARMIDHISGVLAGAGFNPRSPGFSVLISALPAADGRRTAPAGPGLGGQPLPTLARCSCRQLDEAASSRPQSRQWQQRRPCRLAAA